MSHEGDNISEPMLRPANSFASQHNSISKAISAVGVGRHHVLLFLFVGCCWMSDAMEVMLVSVLAPAVGCEWGTSPAGQSLLASAVFIGMMVASSAWGVVADIAGRKVAFGMAAGLAVAAGLMSAVAPSLGVLVACRLVVGAGLVGVLPMYTLLEEWLPADSGSKGKWLVALQTWWSVGTVLEGLLALWLLNTHGWRALLAASAVPLSCILAILPWVPESPHYLAATGGPALAHVALRQAAARNGTTAALERCLQEQAVRGEGTSREVGREGARGWGGEQDGVGQGQGLGNGTVERVDGEARGEGGAGGNRGGYVSVPRDEDNVNGGGGVVEGSGVEGHLQVEVPVVDEDANENVEEAGGGCCRRCLARFRGRRCCCVGGLRGGGGGPCAVCGGGGGGGGGWWCQLQDLLRILLGPELRGRSWRLAVTWFACALSYYGVVMLVPYVAAQGLHAATNGAAPDDAASSHCVPWPDVGNGEASGGLHLVLPTAAYGSMMAGAVAELPSLAWAFLAVDRWSRRRVIAVGLAATAAVLAPIIIAQAGGGGAAATATVADASPIPFYVPPANGATADMAVPVRDPWSPLRRSRRRLQPAWLTAASPASRWLPLASVTLARLFVSGAFTLLYVLTPEQYPARVHGSALGAANTLARLGALAAPYIAVALPQAGGLAEAMGVMAAACAVAAAAVRGLPEAGKGLE